jgi:hypothetical protein
VCVILFFKGAQQDGFRGIYFSYFPLLKNPKHRQATSREGDDSKDSSPRQQIGFRTDSREGKRLKVKKGLKHIMGDIKIDDYYPGGKKFPKHLLEERQKKKGTQA